MQVLLLSTLFVLAGAGQCSYALNDSNFTSSKWQAIPSNLITSNPGHGLQAPPGGFIIYAPTGLNAPEYAALIPITLEENAVSATLSLSCMVSSAEDFDLAFQWAGIDYFFLASELIPSQWASLNRTLQVVTNTPFIISIKSHSVSDGFLAIQSVQVQTCAKPTNTWIAPLLMALGLCGLFFVLAYLVTRYYVTPRYTVEEPQSTELN